MRSLRHSGAVRKVGLANLDHGASGRRVNGKRKGPSSEYRAWVSMRVRCCDKNNPRYGGRGIKVCKRWESFKNFIADMGLKPKGPKFGWSIERRNNDGNYEPGNCYWATPYEQAQNRHNPKRRSKMIAVVYIEREENLEGDHTPGSGVWTRYAGPFTPEEAKAHLTVLGPGYRATGEDHERK